jgi:TonB family protein
MRRKRERLDRRVHVECSLAGDAYTDRSYSGHETGQQASSGRGPSHLGFRPGVRSSSTRYSPRSIAHLLSLVERSRLEGWCFCDLRLLWNMQRVSRLRAESESMVLDSSLQKTRRDLCHQVGVAAAYLRTSKRIDGPAVVGRCTVLFPHGFIGQASQPELKAALAHELAHIRRRDFYKNLGYNLFALPLLWHPGSWLLRRGIDESREMVCDQIAAEAVGTTTDYARTLLRIAGRMPAALHGGSVATVGMFQRNTLERRVTMLMKSRHKITPSAGAFVKAAVVFIGLATSAALAATHLNVHPALLAESGPKRLEVSPGAMAGNLLSRVDPVYPPDAKAKHIQGKVVLSAVIGSDGTPESLRVKASPDKLLSTSALDAVRQWRWKPYLLNGNPVEVNTEINVIYTLAK